MTTQSEYVRRSGVPSDAAAAAEAYNALAEHFTPIASRGVADWMAGTSDGESISRIEKLEAFAATTNPEASMLRGPVKAVFLVAGNATATIDVTPGEPHYLLLLGLVGFKVISQADADALVSRGRVDGFTAATAESIAAARAANDAADADAARRVAYDTLRNAWGLQVYGVGDAELARRLAANEAMPTLAELVTFIAGTLGGGE